MKRNRKVTTAAMTPNDIDPSFAPVVVAIAKDRHVSRRNMFSSSAILTVNGKILPAYSTLSGSHPHDAERTSPTCGPARSG